MTDEQDQSDRYSYRRVATTGCELLNPGGQVIGWTVDEDWAIKIVRLLTEEHQYQQEKRGQA
jgi:hypothetical protein